MFTVIYRWKIRDGKESQFQKAWAEQTRLIRKHRGGLGSRLHRCADGTFLAYAQWPDRETWEKSSTITLSSDRPSAQMKDAIFSSEAAIEMIVVDDLLA